MKSILLAGAMAVVAYGVWHTLTTQPPKDHSDPRLAAAAPAPKWGGDAESPETANSAARSPLVEMPQDGAPPAEPRYPTTNTPNFPTGPIDPGPPLPDLHPIPEKTPAKTAPGVPPLHSSVETGVTGSANAMEARPAVDSLEAKRQQRDFEEALKKAKALIDQRRYAKAHEELSAWYPRRDELPQGAVAVMMHHLDRLAGEVIYSERVHPELAPPYTVSATDTLAEIGRRVAAVPWELLAKINRISNPQGLRNGQSLKIVPGPFHVDIHLGKNELTLLLGHKNLYAGRFKIGVGSQVPLQEGEYRVSKKVLRPPFKPDPVNNPSRLIPGGDPLNPLGDRIVEFTVLDPAAPGGERFGALHGTNDITSIGGPCKEGCIRLAPNEINDIYDMLIANESRVRVRR
jgi:lipoprotein-anchoring transpeptidase ErfK/SrfK